MAATPVTVPFTLTEEMKREIGQHFVFGFHGYEVSDDIRTLIRDYHVGNVILMKRNIQSAAQTRKLVNDLQQVAKEAGHGSPLLIGIDQENGLVSAFSSPSAGTTFPGAMATAATHSAELAEEIARASAEELRMVGMNWTYAPVGDVNSDSRNPVIGVRSFGDDPNEVAKYAVSTLQGHLASHVASCGKHFPGHGDTHVDSHLALPRILKSQQDLASSELVPFRSLIAAGVPSIMTGHMALPLVNGDDTPCSLSRKVTTGWLKEKMQFQGVVVTDCLEMDAIADPNQGGVGIEEGAVRALEAGADVVMICHTFAKQRGAVERVRVAVETGRLSFAEMRESGRRVQGMKNLFCTVQEGEKVADEEWEEKWAALKKRNKELSERAYLKSTTVVWNATANKKVGGTLKVIPLDVGKVNEHGGLVLFTPALESVNKAVDSGEVVQAQAQVQGAQLTQAQQRRQEEEKDGVLRGPMGVRNTAGAHYLALARAVEERKVKVKHVVYSAGDSEFELAQLVQSAGAGKVGAILFVLRNADQKAWQLEYLGRLRALVLKEKIASMVPVVLLSSCGPYDLGGPEGDKYRDWTGYVATYEFTGEALGAAVKVLFGEAQGEGKMPVKVERDNQDAI